MCSLHGNIVALATCQIGSKFLQRIFSRSIKKLDEILLNEILYNLDRLMIDQYGNYFIQSLTQQLDKSARLRLIKSVNHFNHVATNARGTHVLQNLLKQINSLAEEDAILSKIKNAGVSNLATNQHSVHILVQLVAKTHHSAIEFVLEYIENNYAVLCKDRNGISLIKAAQNKPQWLAQLETIFLDHLEELSVDTFGNFAVQ